MRPFCRFIDKNQLQPSKGTQISQKIYLLHTTIWICDQNQGLPIVHQDKQRAILNLKKYNWGKVDKINLQKRMLTFTESPVLNSNWILRFIWH